MVPFLSVQEFIEGFLGENIFEPLVGFGHYVLETHRAGLPCCFRKFLGDGLSDSHFFLFLANEEYKESVTSACLIWVWTCEAWWGPSLVDSA